MSKERIIKLSLTAKAKADNSLTIETELIGDVESISDALFYAIKYHLSDGEGADKETSQTLLHILNRAKEKIINDYLGVEEYMSDDTYLNN